MGLLLHTFHRSSLTGMVISIIMIKVGDGTGRRPADFYDPLETVCCGSQSLKAVLTDWLSISQLYNGFRGPAQSGEKIKTPNAISCYIMSNSTLHTIKANDILD